MSVELTTDINSNTKTFTPLKNTSEPNQKLKKSGTTITKKLYLYQLNALFRKNFSLQKKQICTNLVQVKKPHKSLIR